MEYQWSVLCGHSSDIPIFSISACDYNMFVRHSYNVFCIVPCEGISYDYSARPLKHFFPMFGIDH